MKLELKPGARVGDYTLLEELARGGQGVVHRARHTGGRLVALKLLLDHDLEAAHRLRQEARTLARLRHPHLVTVHDLDALPDGTPWLAMELVEGEDLQRRVERAGLPAPDEVVRVLDAVADALDACHRQGVIHRDVKPQNVLIERGSGRPLLIDFGLLKRDRLRLAWSTQDATTLTREGELLGTPAFMPPEQVDPRFGELGPASDVYALGATLYFLLTGKAPFQGPSTWNVISALLQSPAPDPRQKNPAAPPALAELCLRCLAKDPGDRPLSAASFAQELHEAVAAPAAGRRRRGRLLAGVLGVGLPLGIGGLALALRPDWRRGTQPDPEPALAPQDPPPPPPSPQRARTPAPVAPEERLARAKARFEAEDWSGSLAELERVLEAEPELVGAHLLCGVVRTKLGDGAGALEAFDRAIELEPDLARAFYERGNARYELGDHRGALSDLERAFALDPLLESSAEARHNRGLTYMQLGDLPRARADLDRALELQPQMAEALQNRANLRQLQEDPEGALADYDRAIALAPTSNAHSNRGLLRVRRGELAAAREDFDRAIELDPGYAPAYANRGNLWKDQGEPARARADLDRAIALAPRSPRAHVSRGVLRQEQDDLAGAVEDFERFLELAAQDDPLAAQIREQLERLRAQLGQR